MKPWLNIKPRAGAEDPALLLSFEFIILESSSRLVFLKPTSSSVPTMARTIFLKKRSAVIENSNVFPCNSQCAIVTSQKKVLTSVLDLEKHWKS